MKAKIAVLGAIATIVVLAGACTAALGSPKQTSIDVNSSEFAVNKNISKEVVIDKGSTLVIDLPSNATTGYSWGDAAIGNKDILKQTDTKYVAPEGQVIGAGGTQTWTFTATEKGTTKITMHYGRPWEGGEKAELTFEIAVTVR